MTVAAPDGPKVAAKITAPQPNAGWYPDPSTIGRRYWDGTAWTAHSQALLIRSPDASLDISSGRPKSATLALIMGLVFGPLGMLTATLASVAGMFTVGLAGGPWGFVKLFPIGLPGSAHQLPAPIRDGMILVAITYWLSCALWVCVSMPAPNALPLPLLFASKSD